MKNLSEYILEESITSIGSLGISYEDFLGYIYNQDSYADGADRQYKDRIQAILKKKFGKTYHKILMIIDSMIDVFTSDLNEMGVEPDEVLFRLLYDKLCSTPTTKIDKYKGAGAEAVTFDLGDKIIKCFYKGHIPKDKLEYYKFCELGKYEIFPRVFRIGKGYVVLEKLKVGTKRCKDLISALWKDIESKRFYYRIQDNDLDVKLTPKQRNILNWMWQVRLALADLRDEDPDTLRDFGDLHDQNIGEREDGTIVYFDI